MPLLVDAILDRLAGTGGARLGAGVLAALQGYAFPGNVRELENMLERALAFADDGVIEAADLQLKGARVGDTPPPSEAAAEPAPPAEPSRLDPPQPQLQPHWQPPAAAVAAGDAEALPSNLPDYLNQVERDIIVRALGQTGFNRTQAAGLIGISVRQLRYQMQKLGIHAPEP